MVGTRIRSRQWSIAAAGRFRSTANYVWENASLARSLCHHCRSSASVGKSTKVVTVCDDDFTERGLQRRAEVATELPSYRRINNWMKSIFAVDKKSCLYVNIKRSPPWVDKDEQHEPQSKAGHHPLMVMISAWCDCKGIIPGEILPRYSAFTVDLYCQGLDRTTAKIAEKGPNYATI
ncbi:hypothetical protein Y032_0521g2870 [Ancylostoma ceylanicum]|uniref:Uncharacterized protein n=1 Tax=Ancylostoma ceylanicum TaxID=53326 RepID=A0A016WSB0_9BILA|nr:hypothetical protein Y032_0521g2870 [Ancylostoma ceylanicum]